MIFSQAIHVLQSDNCRNLNEEWPKTGPPTQATGPPRSGAGVGVGMLRVLGIPPLFENKKVLKHILQFPFCFV